MTTTRRFSQLDVFTATALRGNPLAVVHDAVGLRDEQMAEFARWTNLSETTFLLPPTDALADYRVRIFTPGGELPFAGHPTLGSCHAWLAAGGQPHSASGQPHSTGDHSHSAAGGSHAAGEVLQQCGVGLVRVRRAPPPAQAGESSRTRLSFAAPSLLRSGPVEPQLRARAAAALGLDEAALLRLEWIDNGPGWIGALLADAASVLALRPDFVAMRGLKLGVVGPYPAGAECQFEVRAFVPSLGVPEDPVTGSLNAGIAQWLMAAGLAPDRYVAAQGAALGRAGRVHVQRLGDDIWIGGDVTEVVSGTVAL